VARPFLPAEGPIILKALKTVLDREITVVGREMSQSSETAQPGPDFSAGNGLLPAIAQDAQTGEVLMMAYMSPESYAETLATGRAVYFSRSRKKLWRKGEESGNVQEVRAVYVDCDADTILLKVHQVGGAACHAGYKSCFYRQVTREGLEVVGQRVFDPADVYKKKA
jgi:phosphoribosyl-AMP cyclohydrolase